MAPPTREVRARVYERDRNRCAACGAPRCTFQHRQAVGMGGSDIRPTEEQGLTLCGPCNTAAEGSMQLQALVHGWKVRRWVADAGQVPVFYQVERGWYVLDSTLEQGRRRIPAVEARRMMLDVYGEEYETWL